MARLQKVWDVFNWNIGSGSWDLEQVGKTGTEVTRAVEKLVPFAQGEDGDILPEFLGLMAMTLDSPFSNKS